MFRYTDKVCKVSENPVDDKKITHYVIFNDCFAQIVSEFQPIRIKKLVMN